MTPAEQKHALGICAEPEDGHVIIQMQRSFMMLTLDEIRQFDHWLHVAAATALRQKQHRAIVEAAR